jgi:subtilisin family serine protease
MTTRNGVSIRFTSKTPGARDIRDGTRNGKGVIYVFASGSAYTRGDITTMEGYTNTWFTITVDAVGKDGIHASYSTPEASIFVMAPGGDVEDARNHVSALSTDDDACGFPGVGTSFACPVVSGVIALMLEANSELTWRDVQSILASTSQLVYDPRDLTVTRNGVGYWHSNLYGFGIIHAGAAVAAAETWNNDDDGAEVMVIEESGRIDLLITDDPTTTTVATVQVTDNIIVKSVVVFLNVQHLSRGDVDIVLTSLRGPNRCYIPGSAPKVHTWRRTRGGNY